MRETTDVEKAEEVKEVEENIRGGMRGWAKGRLTGAICAP